MIGYTLAHDEVLPPMGPYLFEYVLAGNGVFLRAERPGLAVLMPVQAGKVRGLACVEPYLQLESRVPEWLVRQALIWSVKALPNEALYWFGRDAGGVWRVKMPQQYRGKTSVRPSDPLDAFGAAALIDLHSHNSMAPFFSGTDNRDETGFRIYAVLGSFDVTSPTPPAIRVRVGVYGHFWNVPAANVFEMPYFLRDVEVEHVEH